MAGYSYPDKPRTPPTIEPREHKCGVCWGPFGKSALRCPNEPVSPLVRAQAFLDKRAEMKEAERG